MCKKSYGLNLIEAFGRGSVGEWALIDQ